MPILVATRDDVLVVDTVTGGVESAGGGSTAGPGPTAVPRPTCLSVDPSAGRRTWCGSEEGAFRSDDGGRTWRRAGLDGEHVTAVAVSPLERGDGGEDSGAVVYAGSEPSMVWRSADAGRTWARAEGLLDLPSSSTWSFPPRPETHHVRWIACDPVEPGRLYVAIEAGALVTTPDGGRTWRDRAKQSPYDTHELAIHPERPELLRSAAGDGYWESMDGGGSWSSPEDGLEVTYLRSVAIDPGDPEVAVVSAASHPHSAYMAGRSDGRLYRREGRGRWRPVTAGWPDPPATIAPLLTAGETPGEIWAADERGVHRSEDAGRSWTMVAELTPTPAWLRGIAVLP